MNGYKTKNHKVLKKTMFKTKVLESFKRKHCKHPTVIKT